MGGSSVGPAASVELAWPDMPRLNALMITLHSPTFCVPQRRSLPPAHAGGSGVRLPGGGSMVYYLLTPHGVQRCLIAMRPRTRSPFQLPRARADLQPILLLSQVTRSHSYRHRHRRHHHHRRVTATAITVVAAATVVAATIAAAACLTALPPSVAPAAISAAAIAVAAATATVAADTVAAVTVAAVTVAAATVAAAACAFAIPSPLPLSPSPPPAAVAVTATTAATAAVASVAAAAAARATTSYLPPSPSPPSLSPARRPSLHDHHDGVDVFDYHFKERTVRARSRGMRIACAHLRLSAVRMRP